MIEPYGPFKPAFLNRRKPAYVTVKRDRWHKFYAMAAEECDAHYRRHPWRDRFGSIGLGSFYGWLKKHYGILDDNWADPEEKAPRTLIRITFRDDYAAAEFALRYA